MNGITQRLLQIDLLIHIQNFFKFWIKILSVINQMKKLEDYHARLLALKFPDSDIESDKLADFYAELAESDGYYAGLIGRIIKGQWKNNDNIDFSYLTFLRDKLCNVDKNLLSDKDKIRYKECAAYLVFLEKLPSVINHMHQ